MTRLIGTAQNDVINGTAENDLIRGLRGDDSIQGLQGEDVLYGGQGHDLIQGNDNNDTLRGGKGRDRLFGDKGSDVLYGGIGSDTLTGGADKDRFVLGRIGPYLTTGGRTQSDADVIKDFVPGEDVVALKGGLTFGDLFITQGTDELADSTIISDLLTGQFLAILEKVDDQLTASNFTTLVQPIDRYSGSTNDPGKIDSGIPGFVGPDGEGKVTPSNQVNPIFAAWATEVEDYSPAPGVEDPWRSPQKSLGPVAQTNTFSDIVSLGDLNQAQIEAGTPPGQITLSFESGISDRDGADFAVFENGFDNRGGLFGELAYVEVSSDGENFARFKSDSLTGKPVPAQGVLDPTGIYNLAGKHVNNPSEFEGQFFGSSWGTPFDLETLNNNPLVTKGSIDLDEIQFVRIIDIPGNGSFLDSFNKTIYDSFPTTPPITSGGFDLEAIGVIHPAQTA